MRFAFPCKKSELKNNFYCNKEANKMKYLARFCSILAGKKSYKKPKILQLASPLYK